MPGLSGSHRAGYGRGRWEYGLPLWLFNALRRNGMRFVGAALAAFVTGTAAQAAPVTILAFGDSLTAGYGVAPGDAYPVKLQAALQAKGYDVKIINAGVSGDTTADGLARLDWALGDHPNYALVELGANDALRGLDPAAARSNLDRILTGLAAAKVKIGRAHV